MNNNCIINNRPLISIIIPVFNAEKRLEQCILSVLSQTYKNFELILINDGSSDNSGIICDKYAKIDCRIKVIHKQNGGVSSARNTGIRNALGEFICFIDSDDWVDDTYIDSFFHNQELKEDLFIQGIKYYIPRRNKETIMFKYSKRAFKLIENIDFIIESQLLENGCPVAKLFKMNIIKNNNIYFDENLSINEDHLFVITYFKFVNKLYLSDVIAYHYYSDYLISSLTRKKHSAHEYLEISIKITNAFKELIKRFDQPILFWKTYFPTLGINQILNATIAAVYECESISKIKDCQKLWHLHSEYTKHYAPNNILKRILISNLNSKKTISLYVCAFTIAHYLNLITIIKTTVKKIIRY